MRQRHSLQEVLLSGLLVVWSCHDWPEADSSARCQSESLEGTMKTNKLSTGRCDRSQQLGTPWCSHVSSPYQEQR